MSVFKLTRRKLLIGAGGALVVAGSTGLWLGIDRIRDQRFRNAVERGESFAPNVFLSIEPDGQVTVWLTRSEMGQGVSSALPMMIAEELDADWPRVSVEQAVADESFDYGSLFTAASASVRSMWTELRRAGATARHMLVTAAAKEWGVSRRECITRNGMVRHPPSGRTAAYGELVQEARRSRPPLRPKLKDPAEFHLIGKPLTRIDLPDKLTGKAVYGLDVRLPGMLRAAIARSPMPGGRVQSFDSTATLAINGVRDVLAVSSGVAVVADHTYAAFKGRDALRVEWDAPADARVSDEDISRLLHQRLVAGEAGVAHNDGDAVSILSETEHYLAADYSVPYLAHATMEPMNCAAHVHDQACEVWAPTQAPDQARQAAAAVAGLPLEQVAVHTTQLGGGFGRRAQSDFIREAVELSARLGAPVQVVWSREDDIRNAQYRDASVHRVRAVLGVDGYPSAWAHRIVSASPETPPDGTVKPVGVMGAADLPYAIENVRVEWLGARIPVPTTIWRSVGYSYNTFAVECFIDQLAHQAGKDPVEYRLHLLRDAPRLRHCIEKVAQISGWHSRRPSGAGALGIAACQCFESHVAQVAEVFRSSDGILRVSKVWCVVDCGIIINPDTVIAQLEGGIIFGLTAALHGKLTFVDGVIQEGNFDAYRLLRLNETPDIEVELISSLEPPGGIGETGVPPIAPAVANALFAATGKRVQRLPIRTEMFSGPT